MDVLRVSRETSEGIESSSSELLDLNIDRRRTHTTSANPRNVVHKVDGCSARLRLVKEPQSDIPRKTLSDCRPIYKYIHNLSPRRTRILSHQLGNILADKLFMRAELLLTLTTAFKDAMMVVADDITRKRIVFTPTTVALNNLTTSFTKGSIAFYTVLKDSGVLATTVSIHMIADTSDTVRFH
jgi:hypothetical protein